MSSQEVSPPLSAPGRPPDPSSTAMTAVNLPDAPHDRIVVPSPAETRLRIAKYTRGLSDRSIAWLFVLPTIAL